MFWKWNFGYKVLVLKVNVSSRSTQSEVQSILWTSTSRKFPNFASLTDSTWNYIGCWSKVGGVPTPLNYLSLTIGLSSVHLSASPFGWSVWFYWSLISWFPSTWTSNWTSSPFSSELFCTKLTVFYKINHVILPLIAPKLGQHIIFNELFPVSMFFHLFELVKEMFIF